MSSDVVSNSIKNGILFVLVVLIVHFAARNAIDDRTPTESVASRAFQQGKVVAPFTVLESAPAAASDASGDGSDLMAYVFGKKSTEDPRLDPSPPVPQSPEALEAIHGKPMSDYSSTLPPAPSLPPPPVPEPLTPPIPSGGPGLATSYEPSTSGGCLVVGAYRNENVMCGGALYNDESGLTGFDGWGGYAPP